MLPPRYYIVTTWEGDRVIYEIDTQSFPWVIKLKLLFSSLKEHRNRLKWFFNKKKKKNQNEAAIKGPLEYCWRIPFDFNFRNIKLIRGFSFIFLWSTRHSFKKLSKLCSARGFDWILSASFSDICKLYSFSVFFIMFSISLNLFQKRHKFNIDSYALKADVVLCVYMHKDGAIHKYNVPVSMFPLTFSFLHGIHSIVYFYETIFHFFNIFLDLTGFCRGFSWYFEAFLICLRFFLCCFKMLHETVSMGIYNVWFGISNEAQWRCVILNHKKMSFFAFFPKQ